MPYSNYPLGRSMKVLVQIPPVISPSFIPRLGPIKTTRSSRITCLQSSNYDHNLPSVGYKPISKRDHGGGGAGAGAGAGAVPLTQISPALASDVPYIPPINVDRARLERELKDHGVTFEEITLTSTKSSYLVLKMALRNGSLATLMLPSGLITSYKAPMWHGGMLELLHTTVSQSRGANAAAETTLVNVQGGISLAFKCEIGSENDEDEVLSWSPSIWDLSDVRGSPDEEFIQVELKSSNWEDTVEVKHILTLREDLLSSELMVSNSSKSSSLHLMGSIISHLAVSTPEATYAVGLEGSNFYNRPPVLSNFSIIPPDYGQNKRLASPRMWDPSSMMGILPSWGGRRKQETAEGSATTDREEEMEGDGDGDGEENENYKQLTAEMSRIYTSAPRQFTVIDRGRRNSVIVGRDGFDELYIFSPGSSQEWYGKYAYVCVGQSALLEPAILAPGAQWRGSQHLHNPNL